MSFLSLSEICAIHRFTACLARWHAQNTVFSIIWELESTSAPTASLFINELQPFWDFSCPGWYFGWCWSATTAADHASELRSRCRGAEWRLSLCPCDSADDVPTSRLQVKTVDAFYYNSLSLSLSLCLYIYIYRHNYIYTHIWRFPKIRVPPNHPF